MPRYFFTIRGRDRFKDDSDGTNLPDIAAALSNAERKIRELRKESGYNNDSDSNDDSKGWRWAHGIVPAVLSGLLSISMGACAPPPSRTQVREKQVTASSRTTRSGV